MTSSPATCWCFTRMAPRRRQSPSGEEFGRDRLAQAVKDNYDEPAREMIASLQMAVLEWTDNAGATDDVTFFIIKALK